MYVNDQGRRRNARDKRFLWLNLAVHSSSHWHSVALKPAQNGLNVTAVRQPARMKIPERLELELLSSGHRVPRTQTRNAILRRRRAFAA